jgi:adenine-specific DNA-methyltransferase
VSAIDDLIAQIEDKVLRERLKIETDRIAKEKKFGLVFEEHLPELTPLYKAEVRKGSVVAKRGGDLTNLWRVLSVSDGQVVCMNYNSGEKSQFPVEELMVVANFGEPIFPTLVPMDRVQNGPDDAPWHTLIEADNYHALQLLEYLYTGQVDCIYIDPPYNTGARRPAVGLKANSSITLLVFRKRWCSRTHKSHKASLLFQIRGNSSLPCH